MISTQITQNRCLLLILFLSCVIGFANITHAQSNDTIDVSLTVNGTTSTSTPAPPVVIEIDEADSIGTDGSSGSGRRNRTGGRENDPVIPIDRDGDDISSDTESSDDSIDNVTDILLGGTTLDEISEIRALAEEEKVLLTWNNPALRRFDFVRIMRTDHGQPSTSVFDGDLIYEGRREDIIDPNVSFGTVYAYTFFAKYRSGEYGDGVSLEILVEEKDFFEKAFDDHQAVYEDNALSLIDDFTLTQNETDLILEEDIFIAEAFDPIIFNFTNSVLSGIEEIYLDLAFYTNEGASIKNEVYKFDRISNTGSYRTFIPDTGSDQLIVFTAYGFDGDGNREAISGLIRVKGGNLSAATGTGIYTDLFRCDEKISFKLIDLLHGEPKCVGPWPSIIFWILMTLVAWAIRVLVIRGWK